MQVTIINATQEPESVISECAGVSYGKSDFSKKRIEHCMSNNHMSVFENAIVTFKVEEISRSCSHQLVRHRMASFVQKSQRYTKLEGEDWYVIPQSIIGDIPQVDGFEKFMNSCKEYYNKMLSQGVKPEDARFVLPEATKTDLTVTMNIRELFHFFNLRLDKHAQWEIRKLAEHMKYEVSQYNVQWNNIINMYDTIYPHEVV